MSKLYVTIDSGANEYSENCHEIEFVELGVTEEQWDNLTQDSRYALIKDYWLSEGLPEFTFGKLKDDETIHKTEPVSGDLG